MYKDLWPRAHKVPRPPTPKQQLNMQKRYYHLMSKLNWCSILSPLDRTEVILNWRNSFRIAGHQQARQTHQDNNEP
jgi:hypothetical protein